MMIIIINDIIIIIGIVQQLKELERYGYNLESSSSAVCMGVKGWMRVSGTKEAINRQQQQH